MHCRFIAYYLCIFLKLLPLFPARRPPVEETSSFLKSLLASHGPNYLEKLFGPKARNNLQPLGGVDQVAIALSGEIFFLVLRAIFSSCTRLFQTFNMFLFFIHSRLTWDGAVVLHSGFKIIQSNCDFFGNYSFLFPVHFIIFCRTKQHNPV